MIGCAVNLCCALVVLGQAGPTGVPAHAGFGEQVDHGAAEKAAMRRRIAEDRVKSRYLRREESSILDGLSRIDTALAQRHVALTDLAKQGERLETEIDSADVALGSSQQALSRLRVRIGRRAAAMLRLQRSRVTERIARAASAVDGRRLRDRLRTVMGYDLNLVRQARATAGTAERLSAELKRRRGELESTRVATASAIENRLSLRADRAALLQAIRKERGLVERLTAEIAVAARKLDRERGVIRGLIPPPPALPGGFARQKGRLPWPVVGHVEVAFGKRVDPYSGLVMAQHGVHVRAPHGEPVRVPFAGQVAFARRLPGFGNVVIVDHGAWYTVYGHLANLAVSSGARVARRQSIGALGDTDSNKGAYLYFELRRRRVAVDPLLWLSP